MTEKQLFKMFIGIVKGKENEGYIEWEQEVLCALRKQDDHLLKNRYMRYIVFQKRNNIRSKKARVDSFVKNYIGILLPILTTVMSLFIVNLDILNGWGVSVAEHLNNYQNGMQTVISSTTNLFGQLCQGCMFILGLVSVYYLVAWAVEEIEFVRRTNKELYYDAMIAIMGQELKKRGIEADII